MLLGILRSGNQVSRMLKDAGVNEKELVEAIKALRKGARVKADLLRILIRHLKNMPFT